MISVGTAMRKHHVLALAVFAATLGSARRTLPAEDTGVVPLRIVADIPLPGPAVRFDYQSFDRTHGRLYIAHMNADQLVVFDAKKREVLANLDGFPNVHGVLAVPDINRVFASATGEHKLAIVDMDTLKILATPGPIKYPDGIAYAPGPKRVFVSDEHGDADAVIDATTNTLIATIKLDGGAGNTVYDPGSGAFWLRSTKRTNWFPSTPRPPRSSVIILCPESKVPTESCSTWMLVWRSLREKKTTNSPCSI
jgi:hypothetical protein